MPRVRMGGPDHGLVIRFSGKLAAVLGASGGLMRDEGKGWGPPLYV